MKYLCIALIRFYRKFLSPLKRRPTCRFTPTCSAYAIDAFKNRGFFVGFALTCYRLLRCQPLCPGGYDPVPLYGFRNKSGQQRQNIVYDDSFLKGSRFVFKYNLPIEDCNEKSKKHKIKSRGLKLVK